MMNTTKALSKQFFGAKYQSAGKSLLAAVILFVATHAAEFEIEIAPFILYLISTFFTGGVMWQMLTGKRHIEAMQGMFMLPFNNRSFVFSYVMVLGTHTLITKTLPIWALFFAATSWYPWEIAIAVFCGCMACAVTAAGYRLCRKGHIVLLVLWAAGIQTVILLVRQDAAVLTAGAVSILAAVLYLAFADAYDFYSVATSKRAIQHTGHSGSVFVYVPASAVQYDRYCYAGYSGCRDYPTAQHSGSVPLHRRVEHYFCSAGWGCFEKEKVRCI